jgi:hypothetical protein
MSTVAATPPVSKHSPYEAGVKNDWASEKLGAQQGQPPTDKKTWTQQWNAADKWGKAEMAFGLAQKAQSMSMISAPIVSSAMTANCQTNNLKEQAFLAKQKAKQLDAKWSAIQGDEEAFSSDVQNDTSAALKLISTTQTNMAIQRAIFLRNYKNTQKIGMFLITLVFFALLIKWVFFGKNVDPFIPGLVGKKGKRRSTSRRKSKKKWWKF